MVECCIFRVSNPSNDDRPNCQDKGISIYANLHPQFATAALPHALSWRTTRSRTVLSRAYPRATHVDYGSAATGVRRRLPW